MRFVSLSKPAIEKQALIVDEIVCQQSIVIKPFGGVLEAFEFFAGGALLPAGDIAYVLDLNTICRAPMAIPTNTRVRESI